MNAVNVLFAVLVVLAFKAQAADEKIVDKVDFTPLGEEGHLQLPTELVHKPVCRARPQRGPGFTLVDGTNTLMIVAPWGNSRGLMPLANELKYHLEQMYNTNDESVATYDGYLPVAAGTPKTLRGKIAADSHAFTANTFFDLLNKRTGTLRMGDL